MEGKEQTNNISFTQTIEGACVSLFTDKNQMFRIKCFCLLLFADTLLMITSNGSNLNGRCGSLKLEILFMIDSFKNLYNALYARKVAYSTYDSCGILEY